MKLKRATLRTVADIVSNTPSDHIVLGDLNIVPWDATFKGFLKEAKLSAVRDGFQATYPMDHGIPLIPIDHITYSGKLAPVWCRTLTLPGSDHCGMMAGFAFKD